MSTLTAALYALLMAAAFAGASPPAAEEPPPQTGKAQAAPPTPANPPAMPPPASATHEVDDTTESWRARYQLGGHLEVVRGFRDARAAAADGQVTFHLEARLKDAGWYGFTFARSREEGPVDLVQTVPVLVWAGASASTQPPRVSPGGEGVSNAEVRPGEAITVEWEYHAVGGEGIENGWTLLSVSFGHEEPGVPGYEQPAANPVAQPAAEAAAGEKARVALPEGRSIPEAAGLQRATALRSPPAPAPSPGLAGRLPVTAEPWEQPDALGRVVPWGDEVGGQRVSLQLPRTRLLFGQPIEPRLVSAQTRGGPPHLRVSFEGSQATATLEFTTDTGEAIPFAQRHGASRASIWGTTNDFRLNPTGKFARNGYLVPGNYRLRAVIESKPDPADGSAWIGKITSNTVEFTILPTTADGRKGLVSAALRQTAAPLLASLGAADPKERQAAEADLEALGFDIHPLLEEALVAGTPAQVEAAARVLRTVTALKGHADPAFVGLNFGPFTEPGWKALGNREGLQHLRVEAAVFGPVPLGPTGKLSADAARRLIAQMEDPAPHIRVAAARAVPNDAGEDVVRAVVRLLDDPYSVERRTTTGHPFPAFVIAEEVGRNVLPRLGKSAIGPVVDWLGERPLDATAANAIAVLGDLGPDPRSLAYLKDVLAAGEHTSTLLALKVLGRFGEDGVPLLMESARNTEFNPILRRVAIQELPRAGDAKTVGPLLLDMLDDGDPQLVGAAVRGIDQLEVHEALPQLYRLARDEKTEQNVRSSAIGAVARMGERADVERLLRELLASPAASARGQAAYHLARVAGRDALPRLLEGLSDEDWYVRAMTDGALKVLAGRPEGVGYDPANPDPQPWHDFWSRRK